MGSGNVKHIGQIEINLLNKINNDFYGCNESECKLCPEIQKINYDKGIIKYKCIIHGEDTIDMKEYSKIKHKKANFNYVCKYNCKKNNNIYFCSKCNDYICELCYKEHEHQSGLFQVKEINRDKNLEKSIELLKTKRDNLLYIMKFIDTIINIYEKDPCNIYNNINIEKLANNNINQNKTKALLAKFNNLQNKILSYLNVKYKVDLKADQIEINLNGKNIENLDLKLLLSIEFENLLNLYLSNNNITDIDSLKDFISHKLKKIDLSFNKIKDVSQ